MDNLTRALFVKPEGLLYLFLNAGVPVEMLALAFETNTQLIESSLREAIRKREALALADAALNVEAGSYQGLEKHGEVAADEASFLH